MKGAKGVRGISGGRSSRLPSFFAWRELKERGEIIVRRGEINEEEKKGMETGREAEILGEFFFFSLLFGERREDESNQKREATWANSRTE